MNGGRRYLLDANIFIEAKRRYYAFDLCPGFWAALIWHQVNGRVGSIDRVRSELESGGDDLKNWVTNRVAGEFFATSDDQAVVNWFGQMTTWVQAQVQFNPEAKAEFAAGTDGWLIAYAKSNALVVVTHEVLAPDARRRVPIPNVCNAFDVEHADTFEMLKKLTVQFSWQPPT